MDISYPTEVQLALEAAEELASIAVVEVPEGTAASNPWRDPGRWVVRNQMVDPLGIEPAAATAGRAVQ